MDNNENYDKAYGATKGALAAILEPIGVLVGTLLVGAMWLIGLLIGIGVMVGVVLGLHSLLT